VKSADLKRKVKKILSALDSSSLPPLVSQLEIVLTTDTQVQDLNSHYRGKNKPTDVLSFSQLEGPASAYSHSLGDVVISLDTTERQAKIFGVSLSAELLRLLIHGILHLFGFDHEGVTKNEAARMRRTERRLMKQFCLPREVLICRSRNEFPSLANRSTR
jgi:probable rRNA maturation factor